MTTYTAIADTEIDQDSPVTETLMTKLRNNPIAITEGASGAPRIVQGALDTTQTTYAGLIPAGAEINIATPNSYSFFPEWSNDSQIIISFRSGGSDALNLFNNGDNAQPYSVNWRYINA